eukprot:1172301-Prymnesium_polylepis.1
MTPAPPPAVRGRERSAPTGGGAGLKPVCAGIAAGMEERPPPLLPPPLLPPPSDATSERTRES